MHYAGSDNPDDVAVYATNKPMEIGSKKPCEREIYDLSGNVAEWCACEDADKRKKHIRGGYYQSTADEVTITYVDSAILIWITRRIFPLSFRWKTEAQACKMIQPIDEVHAIIP